MPKNFGYIVFQCPHCEGTFVLRFMKAWSEDLTGRILYDRCRICKKEITVNLDDEW